MIALMALLLVSNDTARDPMLEAVNWLYAGFWNVLFIGIAHTIVLTTQ